MASVVYDGVGGGGVLFEGMKFFILQRVPSRSRWVELIRVRASLKWKRKKHVNYCDSQTGVKSKNSKRMPKI